MVIYLHSHLSTCLQLRVPDIVLSGVKVGFDWRETILQEVEKQQSFCSLQAVNELEV